jgi:hypothetical protein
MRRPLARHTLQSTLPLDNDAAFLRCRDTAERFGWLAKDADSGGGLDVTIPRDLRLLRPTAELRVRFRPTGQGTTTVTIEGRMPWRRPGAGAQIREIVVAFRDALAGPELPEISAGAGSPERTGIRLAVITLITLAILAAVTLDPPERTVRGQTQQDLPDVALGKEELYRLEVALLVFYGGLVLLTPFVYGAIRGRVPLEVSARGAKFADEADESIKETQKLAGGLKERLTKVEGDIARLGAAVVIGQGAGRGGPGEDGPS